MSTDVVERLPQRAFRLVVTGGGTGGHRYPALTAVRTLERRLAGAGRALTDLLSSIARTQLGLPEVDRDKPWTPIAFCRSARPATATPPPSPSHAGTRGIVVGGLARVE